jgi:hypothetical protein
MISPAPDTWGLFANDVVSAFSEVRRGVLQVVKMPNVKSGALPTVHLLDGDAPEAAARRHIAPDVAIEMFVVFPSIETGGAGHLPVFFIRRGLTNFTDHSFTSVFLPTKDIFSRGLLFSRKIVSLPDRNAQHAGHEHLPLARMCLVSLFSI